MQLINYLLNKRLIDNRLLKRWSFIVLHDQYTVNNSTSPTAAGNNVRSIVHDAGGSDGL